MASSYIGSPISLTSISDIRYRGILTGINHEDATIGLSQVFSVGTESRRPPEEFVPPQDKLYDYIVFRASEVKHLALDTEPRPAPPRSIHDDPAIVNVAQPSSTPAQTTSATTTPASTAASSQPPIKARQPNGAGSSRSAKPAPATIVETGPVRSASASLETVERAIGDLRISNNGHSNPRRGRGRGGAHGYGGRGDGVPVVQGPVIVDGDFDFATSNEKFDKASIFPSLAAPNPVTEVDDQPDSATGAAEEGEPVKFYDRSRSFFDDISSDSKAKTQDVGGGRGRGNGRGRGRSRREDERNKNLSTFGETSLNSYGNGQGGYWQGRGGGGGGGYRGRRRRNWGGDNSQPRPAQPAS